MKKYIFIFYILFSFFNVFADESHYKNLSKIEMDILRNDKVIGYSNYFFKHAKDTMMVENYTKFIVEMFGVKVFSINSKSKEIYKKDKLISFESTTLQNDKKKYVKLNYDEKKNKFIINGSSYVGEANLDNVIGNWWNSKILESKTQISPLSGSIKKQNVKNSILIFKAISLFSCLLTNIFEFNKFTVFSWIIPSTVLFLIHCK